MKHTLYSILLTAAMGIQAKAGLIGSDFTNGQIYDVNTATGAATNARGGTPSLVGVAFASNGVLYGLTTGGGSLYTINTTTGAATLVGSTGLSDITEGDIAFDPTTGILYGLQESNPRNLFTIDTTTAAGTVVGEVGSPYDFSAMAFDSAGNLFAIDTQGGVLLTVNKSTGAVLTSIALSLTLGNTAGMAFDPSNGVLYVADGNDAGNDKLYTLNTSTGVLSAIGPTGLSRGLAGLSFTPVSVRSETPEPASAALVIIGIAAASIVRSRKRG